MRNVGYLSHVGLRYLEHKHPNVITLYFGFKRLGTQSNELISSLSGEYIIKSKNTFPVGEMFSIYM